MLVAAVSIVLYGRQNPSRQITYYWQLALVYIFASEAAFALYSHAYDTFNLIGHVYKVCAYYFILKMLVENSILQPYLRISRLAVVLKNFAKRNALLYREAKASRQLIQETFIQLGATLASKHKLDDMLEQIVNTTATVFSCNHVFLGLADGNANAKLRLVAYRSTFSPPLNLCFDKSFMGRMLLLTVITVRCGPDLALFNP